MTGLDSMPRLIVALETSCDESALAVFEPARGFLGEWVHSQVAQHVPYGGVVPELASREHLRHLPPLLGLLPAVLGDRRPDCVAVTCGPGLAACLALGLSSARALALAWGAELRGVNHLRGHAFSPFIPIHAEDPGRFAQRFEELCPHLGLIVSGGNTLLVEITTEPGLRVLAQTVDDAAGEAFDKGAKLLGMPYPGGPKLEEVARPGHPGAFPFPATLTPKGDARFSFSGLKTSLRYRLEKWSDAEVEAHLPDIAAGYQEAVVRALAGKTGQVLNNGTGWASLGLSGGVANNRRLQEALRELAVRHNLPLLTAKPAQTGDNAAMIAFAACLDPRHCLREPSPDSGRPEVFQPVADLHPSWPLPTG